MILWSLLSPVLKDINTWMQLNFSNENKTEIAVFGQYLTKDNGFGPFAYSNQSPAESLGVIPGSSFIFDKQIDSVVRTSFCQLRLLSKIKPYLGFQGLWECFQCFH